MIAWLPIVALQLALLVIILLIEVIAIATQEKYYPTFSALLWRMFQKYPWTRYVVGLIILLLLAFNAWAFIHIFFGPCAFGIC